MTRLLIRQAMRFAAVGGVATALHVLVALSLYEILGISPIWANFLAFLVALVVSYSGNRCWTFGRKTEHYDALPRFALIAITMLLLNQLLILLMVYVCDFDMWAALAMIVVVTTALSFTLNRKLTFGTMPVER